MTHQEKNTFRFNLEEAEQSIEIGMKWLIPFYMKKCDGLDSIDSVREIIKNEMLSMASKARHLAASDDTEGVEKLMTPLFGCFRFLFYSNEQATISDLLNSMYPRTLEAMRVLNNLLSAPREGADNPKTAAEWQRLETVLKQAQDWENDWARLNRVAQTYIRRRAPLDLANACKDKEGFLYNLCKPFIPSALPDVAACLALSCDPVAGALTEERKGETLIGEVVSTAPTLQQLNFMWRIPFLYDAAKTGPRNVADAVLAYLNLQSHTATTTNTDTDPWQTVCGILRRQHALQSNPETQPMVADTLSLIRNHLSPDEQMAAATSAALPLCKTGDDFSLLANFVIDAANDGEKTSYVLTYTDINSKSATLLHVIPTTVFALCISAPDDASDPYMSEQWERFADCLEEKYGEHGMAYMARKYAEGRHDGTAVPGQKAGAYEELMQNAGFFAPNPPEVDQYTLFMPKCPAVLPAEGGAFLWIEKNATLSAAWRLLGQIHKKRFYKEVWPPNRFSYIVDAALTYQNKDCGTYSRTRFDRRRCYDAKTYRDGLSHYRETLPGEGFFATTSEKPFPVLTRMSQPTISEGGAVSAIRILYRVFVAHICENALLKVQADDMEEEEVEAVWEMAFADIRYANRELGLLAFDMNMRDLSEDIGQTEWLDGIRPADFAIFIKTLRIQAKPQAEESVEPVWQCATCFETSLSALRRYDRPLAEMILKLKQSGEPYMPLPGWSFLKTAEAHIRTLTAHSGCDNFVF